MPEPAGGAYPSPILYPGSWGPFVSQINSSLAPWADPAGAWFAYNAALGAPFEQVASIVLDQGSPDDPANYVAGWSILLDPDNCPAQFIPFGASFVGAVIPPGTDELTARAIWKQEAGFQRGTPSSIVAAAQRNLIGTKSCVLLERVPNAYSFVLVVRPEECQNPAALTTAVNAVKPAGVTWQLVQTDGWTLYQMEAAYATISALEAAFATIFGVESDQVGH